MSEFAKVNLVSVLIAICIRVASNRLNFVIEGLQKHLQLSRET